MDIVVLQGKSQHGKNRVREHGDRWMVREPAPLKWRPNSTSEWREFKPNPNRLSLESIDCTCPTCEKWGQDWRWIDVKNDPNFEILRRETIGS